MLRIKRVVCSCIIVGLTAVAVTPTAACVGARALAMGGAFTGLADDASATYWNPAALVDLPEGKDNLTVMHTANNRDLINYQEFLSYSGHAGRKDAFGLSYIRYKMAIYYPELGLAVSGNQNWYWASYGTRVGTQTSVGANVRFRDNSGFTATLQGAPVTISSVDTDVGFDLALYHHANDRVTIGLLVQDVNEPETTGTVLGERGAVKHPRNFRPGVGVRLRDDVTLSAELYNATDEGDKPPEMGGRAIRLGIEKKFPRAPAEAGDAGGGFALRAGWYGNADAVTLGAGMSGATWSADVALLTGDLENTWLVSATTHF